MDSLSVLLVNPPSPVTPREVLIPSLGLGYLAAVLEQEEIPVSICDMAVESKPWSFLRKNLEEKQPDIVGITCATCNFPLALQVARECKTLDKAITTVLGGVHATFVGESILEKYMDIDVVVKGEGEISFLELAKSYRKRASPRKLQGIIFRKGHQVHVNPVRPYIDDLDAIPFPARHLFPLQKYSPDYTNMLTSRGCPYSCIFCPIPRMWGNRVRFGGAHNVVDEMQEIQNRHHYDRMYIEDDVFTFDRNRILEICDEIIKREMDVEWACNTRVDLIDLQIAKAMSRAGCSVMSFGIESGSQRILDRIRKNVTITQVEKAVKIARKADIDVRLSFIVGLPDESEEDIEKSVKLAEELDADIVAFNNLVPFPGTEIYERSDDYGLHMIHPEWSEYYFGRQSSVIETSKLSSKEISNMIVNAIERLTARGYISLLKAEDSGEDDEE